MTVLARISGLAICATMLTACPFQTREDIKKQDEERQLKEQVANIQRTRADSEMKYSDLQAEIRAIAGRVDTLDHNMSTSDKNQRQELDSLKKMIEAQNEKLKLVEEHMQATEARLMAAVQAAPPPEPKGGGESKKGESGGGGAFAEAEALFKSKEFKKAIVKYQTYRDKNPKGKDAAEATYKIGVCFAELGLKRDAKEFYQETVDTYPGSPSAKKAKYRLSNMK